MKSSTPWAVAGVGRRGGGGCGGGGGIISSETRLSGGWRLRLGQTHTRIHTGYTLGQSLTEALSVTLVCAGGRRCVRKSHESWSVLLSTSSQPRSTKLLLVWIDDAFADGTSPPPTVPRAVLNGSDSGITAANDARRSSCRRRQRQGCRPDLTGGQPTGRQAWRVESLWLLLPGDPSWL